MFFIFSVSSKELKNEKSILKTCIYSEPRSLDTRKTSDYISTQLLFLLYRGLMHYNSDNTLVCSLAKSYHISKDKKKYTFHLKDAFWSDGSAITAYDFEKSWKTILSPAFPSPSCELLYDIKNAENAKKAIVGIDEVKINATDAKTLVVELENPSPYFLFLTSLPTYFPMPSNIIEKKDNLNEEVELIYSGPYKLKKWLRNNQLILEKNPYFYNSKSIDIDLIHFYVIPNENTAFQMYENNEVDFLSSFLSPLTVDILGKVLLRNDVKVVPILGFSFLTFNVDIFPFSNPNLRKAFSLAIDRKSIVQNITQLDEKIATRCLPFPISSAQNSELIKSNDKKLALKYFNKGLEELNISKENLNISLTSGSYIIHKKEAESLKQMWEKAFDIQIKLNICEDKIALSKFQSHDYQIGLARLIMKYNDPISIFERFKYKFHPKNYSSWEDKKYIKILDYAKKTSDVKKRSELIEIAESLLLDAMPIAPLYFYNYTLLTKKRITGLYNNSVGDLIFDEVKMSER
jgi:oligopeptide transport system substrate-binding protein